MWLGRVPRKRTCTAFSKCCEGRERIDLVKESLVTLVKERLELVKMSEEFVVR